MPHARKLIRDAFKAIVTGLPTTGSRVFVGRTRALEQNHLPTLLVYTLQRAPELVDLASSGKPSTLQRTVVVAVEGRVVSKDPPDDQLDQIALEIEQAVGAGQDLNGLVKEVTLASTDGDVEAPGDRHIGAIRLNFRVVYMTKEAAPHIAI